MNYSCCSGRVHLAGIAAMFFAASLMSAIPSPAHAQRGATPAKKQVIDRKFFVKQFRRQFHPFKDASRVAGYMAIFDHWDSDPKLKDLRWLAYALATAYHETGRRMQAIREGFCKTDACSIRAVTRLYQRGRISRNYARIDPVTGRSYFGRGHVQLTHARNYKIMGKATGIGLTLYRKPSRMAYALATAYHETGRRMQAIREGFCKTDACSIRAVTRLYQRGRISRNYARIDPVTGRSYFGRGHVQLTHARNYKIMGKATGIGLTLYRKPELALHLEKSVNYMFVGMVKGLYTGKKLRHYFSGTKANWGGARRIINGLDKYKLIANYGIKFRKALRPIDAAPKSKEQILAEREQAVREQITALITSSDTLGAQTADLVNRQRSLLADQQLQSGRIDTLGGGDSTAQLKLIEQKLLSVETDLQNTGQQLADLKASQAITRNELEGGLKAMDMIKNDLRTIDNLPASEKDALLTKLNNALKDVDTTRQDGQNRLDGHKRALATSSEVLNEKEKAISAATLELDAIATRPDLGETPGVDEQTLEKKAVELAAKEQALLKKEAALLATERAQSQQASELEKTRAMLTSLSNRLTARENELEEIDKNLSKRDRELANRAADLVSKEQDYKDRKRQLDERTVQLDARSGELASKETGLRELAAGLGSKKSALDARESALNERDLKLSAKLLDIEKRETALNNQTVWYKKYWNKVLSTWRKE